MNERELLRYFPNASKSCVNANVGQDRPARLPTNDQKPIKGRPLDKAAPRTNTGVSRLKIRFTIYATRPADWDGWHVKELQDLLVNAGCLRNDCWDQLSGEVVSEKVYSEAEERTEIEIYANSD